MDISILSFIAFLAITVSYYLFPSIGKLPITIDMLKQNEYTNYAKRNAGRLFLYFSAVVLSQFLLVIVYLVNKCSGTAEQNITSAALLTFIPWIFIFGVMVIVLNLYPALKTSFSNVVGYYFISNKATNILTSILTDTNINNILQNPDLSQEQKNEMAKSTNAVMNIFGNKSILINKMFSDNFLAMWDMLKPIMKNGGNIPNIDAKQEELFNLIVLKDNVGEAFWYVYTGIIIVAFIAYRLAVTGCNKDLASMKAGHSAFVKKVEEKDKNANALNVKA